MIRSIKPNKCKHCKMRMPEDKARHVLHEECVDPWLVAERARKERKEAAKWRAAARVERMLDKVKREKQKTIPDLIDEAQTAFNLFIRLRDAEKPCICCNKPLGSGTVGGRFDCGHYRSRGGAPHLRFNEDNAHGQRKYCNRHGAGRAVDYRIGLIARIGLDRVEALEFNNEVHKWTREELIAIKAEYMAKAKELKARQS